jgi:hypothetical protein
LSARKAVLTCSGRADEQVELPPGDGDLRDGLGLLGAEAMALDRLSGDRVDDLDVHRWAGDRVRPFQESVLGREQVFSGEDRGVLRSELAAAVGAGECGGCRRQVGRREPQRSLLGGFDDQPGDGFAVAGSRESPAAGLASGLGVQVGAAPGRSLLADRDHHVATDLIDEVEWDVVCAEQPMRSFGQRVLPPCRRVLSQQVRGPTAPSGCEVGE